MKRIFLFLCAAALATLQLLAVPAMPGKRTFINPDGTTVEYELRGDEFYHFMADAENNVLEKNAAGFLVAKEQISNETVAARRAASPVAEAYKARQAGTVNLAQRGLFILVNFSGKSFQSGNTLSAMTQMISSTGHTYTYNGATGSVLDYFIDQSGDQYHPQFDVYGPVTVSSTSSYYAGSDGTTNAYKMVIEACQGLDNQVNFANYDNDGDGYVDFIYVIYAGKGQADGGGTDCIWPHQYNVSYKQTVTLDGVKLGSYACGGELNGSSGARNGIGTLCHEFSHVLGLPDYYDTDYGTNYKNSATPGKWHLMDQGSYNNNQNTPAGYAPHDKYFMGWYTPTILNDPENVTLPADGETYRMINSQKQQLGAKSTQTIYYLENRQKTGWNAYVPGHGLLVWKVTYNASRWNSNTPNNTAGDLSYSLVSASGNTTNIGNARDPFPGSGNVTTYTPISGNGLTDIEESNSEIHFKFDGGITRPYTVTFVAGDHATCNTSTLTQASMGASITLPTVTNISPNYKFLGWSATEGAVTAECGTANASYVPKRDITLYAVVVQDGYLVTFDTETYGTTLGHGTCPVSELREAGSGAGIVLPEFTADPGYVFQGWVYISNDRLYLAGETGDRVFPAQDMTFYSYVFPSDSVFCEYAIMSGVEKTSGPDQGWFRASDGYTATFVAADQFLPLTAANTTVRVKVDGDIVANCYSFANNTLTISLTANQIVGDVEVNIWATSDYTPCAAYSYTYAQAGAGVGTKTLGAYSWSITGTVSSGTFAGQWSNNANRLQGGTNRKCTQATYTTNSANNCLIDKITVTAWCTRANGTIQAYINNEALGDAQTMTAAQAEYTFSNSSRLQGQVKFVINNATSGQSYYIYVKAINVTMVQDIAITPPGEPIHIQGINYIQALYRNYYYGYDQYEPWYLWYPVGIGSDASDYPWINFILEAPIKTALTGTHNTLGITGYVTSASDTTEAWNESYKIKFTYLRDTTYLYTSTQGSFNVTSYIYHVESRWIDDITGQEYYIDDDAYADIYDYDAYQDGDYDNMEITPTGDTNPRYGKIRHYLQHIDDDGYDLDEEVVMTAPAGTTLEAERNSYNGFLYPAAQNITITNANNSQANAAVVNYYYDRRTYQVNFIVDGTTTQSETLRYGATPTYKQATPTKQATAQASYTFAGWSPTIRIVRQSDTYTALFNATEHIIVSFNNNGRGTNPDSQTLTSGQTVTRPADPTADGYTFGGWYTETECVNAWNFSTPVTASMTLFAKWTPNQHTLTWDANGGGLSGTYTSGSVAYGTAIVAPTATRTGYTFANWDQNVPATMPDNDLTFVAQWNPNTNTAYKVRHNKQNLDDDNFTLAEEENLTGTTGAEVTPAVKNYQGFSAPAQQTANIQADGSLVIIYNYTRNVHSLTWDANGGTITGSYTRGQVKYGKAITAPAAANVTKTGASFNGWLPANIPSTMPDDDQTFVAQWLANTYTISFTSEDINKGTVTVTGEKATYTYGDQVTILAEAKAGYVFSQWSDGSANAERTLTIGVDVTQSLVASFVPSNHTLYIIRHFQQHIEDNGYDEILPVDSVYGTTDQLTASTPYIKPYTGFDVQPFDEELIAADGSTEINIYYHRHIFVIRFLVDNVEKQRDELRYQAQPAFRGATPTKEPDAQFTYSFGGWNPTIVPAVADQDYTAKWNTTVNQYTVTFNANGHGVAPAPQTVDYNTPATEPAALEETGWTFGGWFKESNCSNAWNFSTPIVAPIELFAKWTVNKHELTWNANGGTITSAAGDYTSGLVAFGTPIVAPAVERTGFNFIGWNPSVKETMPDENVTYVANWQEKGDTPYKVLHKRQNLAGTAFDIVEEEDFTGVTGAPVTPLVKDYEGFEAPAPQTANILADGSLEIVYEYTRKSYSLVWDANGGALSGDYTHGSVKFEAPITAPADPVWVGHTFHNWDKAIPATMPSNDLTLIAQWTINTYSGITFTSEDETEGTVSVTGGKDTYTYGDAVTITADANDGYHFTGWVDGNGDVVSTNEVVNITVDASTESLTATFAPNTNTAYKVSHYLQNLLDDEYTLDETENFTGTTGALIVAAPRTINGFITPANQVDVVIAGDGNTEIKYYYKRRTYSLTWNANGGVLLENGRTEGEEIKFQTPIVAAQAERTGYNFLNWGREVPTEMPAENLAFVAQWEAKTYSGITFTSEDENEGTVIVSSDKNEYTFGDEVTITADAADGYTFAGWVDGNGDVVSTNEVINITIDENTGSLTATFTANTNTKYTVRRFIQNIEDDNFTYLDEIVDYGTTGTEVTPQPEEILGFSAPAAQTVVINGNGETVIIYNYTRNSYALSWDANGGVLLENGRTEGQVKYQAPIVAAQAERPGYNFLNWGKDVPTTMPYEDLEFVAQWEIKTYPGITFTSEDETEGTVIVSSEKDEYTYGDEITITADASDGYTFTGWVDENGDVVSTDEVINITVDENTGSLTATFTPNLSTKYIVRRFLQNIEDDEYTLLEEKELFGETGATVTPQPADTLGFSTPEAQTATILGDGSLVIEYRYIRNSYSLVWNANGGEIADAEYTQGDVKYGAEITAPVDVIRAHFFFRGWDKAVPATMPAENLEFVAQWEENPEGIEIIIIDKTVYGDNDLRIYDFNGRDVTGLNGNLGSGLYIVVSGGKTAKIAIR